MPTHPIVNFHLLVQAFGMQALMCCGRVPNPATGKAEKNLDVAQLQISFLEVIEEKTRGNLSDDEQKILAAYLHEARMAFVEASGSPTEETPPEQKPPPESEK